MTSASKSSVLPTNVGSKASGLHDGVAVFILSSMHALVHSLSALVARNSLQS